MAIVEVDAAKEGADKLAQDDGVLAVCKEAYAVGAQAKTASILANSTNNHQDHRRAMDLQKQAQTLHETAAVQSKIMDDVSRAKEHVQAANYHADQYNDHRLSVTPSYF